MRARREGPLEGCRVVVTRARHQAGALQEAIHRSGGDAPLLPLLQVAPPRDPTPLRRALETIDDFDVLVFTSANAVPPVAAALSRRRPGSLVAAVGEATRAALAEAGVDRVIRPDDDASRAEGLLNLLRSTLDPGTRVLLPQAGDARSLMSRGLLDAGFEVVTVTAYEKRLPPEAPKRYRDLFDRSELGWVTFTSPRIARHFHELVDAEWERRRGELRAASIGPVTSAALRELGVEPAAEAAVPAEEALVAAIVEALRFRSGAE